MHSENDASDGARADDAKRDEAERDAVRCSIRGENGKMCEDGSGDGIGRGKDERGRRRTSSSKNRVKACSSDRSKSDKKIGTAERSVELDTEKRGSREAELGKLN